MKSRLILCGMALAAASVSQAAFTPLAIQSGSYNADAIVEATATPVLKCVTTATLDAGTNNTASTWYEVGYDTSNPSFGLPAAGQVVQAQDDANHSFKMPPTYVGNNGILIDTVFSNATFTVTTPAAYSKLSFAASGGNGGDVIGIIVHHQDGTTETNSFQSPDWFGATGILLTTHGRMGDNVAHTLQTNGDNPRVYFRDVTLSNTTSPVVSIDLYYISGSSGSHNDVLAVSGSTSGGVFNPIDVTGFTHDFVVEASAAKRGVLVSTKIVDGTNGLATSETIDQDNNTGYTYYEKGYNFNIINNLPFIYGNPTVDAICQNSGIPTAGSTFTNGDHAFTMAPDYTTNDVVWMNPTNSTATITPSTPTAATALSFLGAAANGPINPMVMVHHQDGSVETNIISIQDWFSSTTPMWIPNGRVDTGSGQFSQVVVTGLGANRLFASDLPLANTVSPVTSVDLLYTNTVGRSLIFAVSYSTGPVLPIFQKQPTDVSTIAGSNVNFSVVVVGTAPFSYQWQKGTNANFVNVNNGGNISGATAASLNITAANYFVDSADYRVIVSNGGGSVTSSVAHLTLYSTMTDVTQPGDPISAFGGGLFGDGPAANAIDNSLSTKFGINVSGPCGLKITPAAGATLVSALRVFTANDAPERDPADYMLEGSLNNGSTWTLIASNSLTLPDARNSTGAPDPLTSAGTEVSFANANGYTTYRLTFSHYKGGTGQTSCQVGEVELLGVSTNLPLIVDAPAFVRAYVGDPLSVAGTVAATQTPTIHWQKQTGGVFNNLTDGGAISGSTTATLNINPTTFGDTSLYRIVATSGSTTLTSSVVEVTIVSTNVDITTPGDLVTNTGDTSPFTQTPENAIDNTFAPFASHGSGPGNTGGGDGFAPFGGPITWSTTPSVGQTVVSGIRFYTGGDGSQDDPADFKLEGSNDGGTTYQTIVNTTALSLSDLRNDLALGLDPLTSVMQEIRFSNTAGYTSYRLTFLHTKDDNTANKLSIGEIELLGVVGGGVSQPVITAPSISGGNLSLSGTGGTPGGTYSVLTNASLSVPVSSWGVAATGTFDGSGNFSLSLPVSVTTAHLFYTIQTP
ncbi:MAG TPA: hypothetical protein VL527_03450 [Dongiaceae bacterium]|nr:hypothetical protein [Dongiaceae bacterium]